MEGSEKKPKEVEMIEAIRDGGIMGIAVFECGNQPIFTLRGKPDELVNLIANAMARNAQLAAYMKAAVLAYQNGPIESRDSRERTILAAIGPIFHAWADEVFHPKNKLLNKEILLGALFRDFNLQTPDRIKVTPKGFRQKLMLWCELMGYEFCPEALKEGHGKILRMMYDGYLDENLKFQTNGLSEKIMREVVYVATERTKKPSLILGLDGAPVSSN